VAVRYSTTFEEDKRAEGQRIKTFVDRITLVTNFCLWSDIRGQYHQNSSMTSTAVMMISSKLTTWKKQ